MSFLRLLLVISLGCILVGCSPMPSMPEKIDTSTLLTGSMNLGAMTFSEKLSDIEKSGIRANLIGKDLLYAPLQSGLDEYSLGTIDNWKTALQTPCTGKEVTAGKVFTTGFEDKNPVLFTDYCTGLPMTENKNLITKLFGIFDSGSVVRDIPGDEFDPSRIQSNVETNPSTPRTPLEIFVTIHGVKYNNAVVRFSTLRQHKNSLLMLTAGAQEPSLPGYRIARIYRKGDSLYLQYYIQGTAVDIYRLDTIYGTGFTQELMSSSYEINTHSEKQFDKNTQRLLIGDFVTQPSIINKQLEEKIRQEFLAL